MSRDYDGPAAHGRSQMRRTAVISQKEMALLKHRAGFAKLDAINNNRISR
jgi:hypothetical protein